MCANYQVAGGRSWLEERKKRLTEGESSIAGLSALYSHMRVSVPGIPQAILNAKPVFSVKSSAEATERLTEFIGDSSVAVLTGAGVSVDSGIRAYRGQDGRYMNPNYK